MESLFKVSQLVWGLVIGSVAETSAWHRMIRSLPKKNQKRLPTGQVFPVTNTSTLAVGMHARRDSAWWSQAERAGYPGLGADFGQRRHSVFVHAMVL